MNWIPIIFFSLAVLILCTMFRRDADIISPARLFGMTWSIVLALASLKLSRLQFEWTGLQWVYVLMGPVSFLAGLFVTYVMNVGMKLYPVNEIRQILRTQRINDTNLFYFILLAFITYVIGYSSVALAKGQIPLFTRNPSAARTEFLVFGIAMFIFNMNVVVFFSFVYHLFVHDNLGKKRILKIISFITLLTYLFLLQRYQVIMVTVMVFALLYYSSRYIRLKTMLVFVAFGTLVFYLIATLRSGQIIQFALYKTSLMKFSPQYAVFTEPICISS